MGYKSKHFIIKTSQTHKEKLAGFMKNFPNSRVVPETKIWNICIRPCTLLGYQARLETSAVLNRLDWCCLSTDKTSDERPSDLAIIIDKTSNGMPSNLALIIEKTSDGMPRNLALRVATEVRTLDSAGLTPFAHIHTATANMAWDPRLNRSTTELLGFPIGSVTRGSSVSVSWLVGLLSN